MPLNRLNIHRTVCVASSMVFIESRDDTTFILENQHDIVVKYYNYKRNTIGIRIRYLCKDDKNDGSNGSFPRFYIVCQLQQAQKDFYEHLIIQDD